MRWVMAMIKNNLLGLGEAKGALFPHPEDGEDGAESPELEELDHCLRLGDIDGTHNGGIQQLEGHQSGTRIPCAHIHAQIAGVVQNLKRTECHPQQHRELKQIAQSGIHEQLAIDDGDAEQHDFKQLVGQRRGHRDVTIAVEKHQEIVQEEECPEGEHLPSEGNRDIDNGNGDGAYHPHTLQPHAFEFIEREQKQKQQQDDTHTVGAGSVVESVRTNLHGCFL